MARVVMTTFGSFGDLYPYLAVGRGLRRRGHEAVIAAPAVYRSTIETAGLSFAAVRPDVDLEDPEVFARAMHPRTGTEFVVRQLVLPALDDSLDDLREACRGADLLTSHALTYAAPLLGESEGLPWVSTILSPMAFLSAHDPPALAPAPWISRLRALGPGATRLVLGALKRVSRSWSAPIRARRSALGLDTGADPFWEGQFSPRGTLALFSSAFAAPQPDWPRNTTACGFPFHDVDFGDIGRDDHGRRGLDGDQRDGQGGDEQLEGDRVDGDRVAESSRLSAFLDAGAPPLVFSLGSSAARAAGDFHTAAVTAARALGHRAVLVVGDAAHPRGASESVDPHADMDPVTGDDLLVLRSAALHALFPRAAALIHAGGIGTVGQALRAGRPQLVVPFSHDQFDNATRVARHGVGMMLPQRRARAPRLAEALRHLLEDETAAARAAALARTVQAENGVETACDALERALASAR